MYLSSACWHPNLLRDFVLEKIMVPLFKAFEFFNDIDQFLIWFSMIGIIIFIAYRSLAIFILHLLQSKRSKTRKKRRNETPIEKVALLLITARNTVLFRKQLIWYLQDIILETLNHQEKLSPMIVKERLESGTLDVPPKIADFLKLRFSIASSHFWEKYRKRSRKTKNHRHKPGLDPEIIVNFLEQRLDIKNEKYY